MKSISRLNYAAPVFFSSSSMVIYIENCLTSLQSKSVRTTITSLKKCIQCLLCKPLLDKKKLSVNYFCYLILNRRLKWRKYQWVFCWLHGCLASIVTHMVWVHAQLLNRWPNLIWIRQVDLMLTGLAHSNHFVRLVFGAVVRRPEILYSFDMLDLRLRQRKWHVKDRPGT